MSTTTLYAAYDRLIAYPLAKLETFVWYLLPHVIDCVLRGEIALSELLDYTAWLAAMSDLWLIEWGDDGPSFHLPPLSDDMMVSLAAVSDD